MHEQPGYYQGKHYTAYLDTLQELKHADKQGELERLLLALVQATEAESRAGVQHIVAPRYYEELAILYRKQEKKLAEVAILERYFSQKHAPNEKLSKRLDTARKRAQAKKGHNIG